MVELNFGVLSFIGDSAQPVDDSCGLENFEKIGNKPRLWVGDDVNSDNRYSSPFESSSFSQKEIEKTPELCPPKVASGWRFCNKSTMNKLSASTPE